MELRANRILRGREFIMKDFYSFHRNEQDLAEYYGAMKRPMSACLKGWALVQKLISLMLRVGVFQVLPWFQMLTDVGGHNFICEKCRIAINKEIKKDQPNCPSCGNADLKEEKSIEVGTSLS